MTEWSTSLTLQENATQNHEIPLCTLTGTLILKTRKKAGVGEGHGERKPLWCRWWERKTEQRPRETVRACLEELNLELPFNLPILLPNSYPKAPKAGTCTPMFRAARVAAARSQKPAECLLTHDGYTKRGLARPWGII